MDGTYFFKGEIKQFFGWIEIKWRGKYGKIETCHLHSEKKLKEIIQNLKDKKRREMQIKRNKKFFKEEIIYHD